MFYSFTPVLSLSGTINPPRLTAQFSVFHSDAQTACSTLTLILFLEQVTWWATVYPPLHGVSPSNLYNRLDVCVRTQLPWWQWGGWWDGREPVGCWGRHAGECGAEWQLSAVVLWWRREQLWRWRRWWREQLARQPSLQKSSFNTFGEELVELPRTSHWMKQGCKISDTFEDSNTNTHAHKDLNKQTHSHISRRRKKKKSYTCTHNMAYMHAHTQTVPHISPHPCCDT